jgi:hypothetical protein
MTYLQAITPNPNIPCKPGWCLAYVNEAFGVPKRFGTATNAWWASETKHFDRAFPAGLWVPVWYALANEPAGHVVLLAPDGSCYSTSDLSTVPRHHPDLADLEWYYAKYGQALTYRGWTEDVEGTSVITLEENMSAQEVKQILDFVQAAHDVTRGHVISEVNNFTQAASDVTRVFLADRVREANDPDVIVDLIPEEIAQQVIDGLAKRLAQ